MTDNADQQEFWSTTAGQNWVNEQQAMDALLQPVLDLLLEKAALQPGDNVLDIGCGAGTSTAHAARQVTGSGTTLGLDISPTLLAQAEHQYGHIPGIRFLQADAQTHAFPDNEHDVIISRFGVMFFADSTAAFANMSKALRPGGRIVLACWGPAGNNPWFMIPAQVAKARLGAMPKTDRTLPGPFAFEDQSRVLDILEHAGLSDVTAKTCTLNLTPVGGLAGAADLCCTIGPAQSVLRHFNGANADRAVIKAGISAAFAPFDDDGLHVPADINIFTAIRANG